MNVKKWNLLAILFVMVFVIVAGGCGGGGGGGSDSDGKIDPDDQIDLVDELLAYADDIISLTNAERLKEGIPALLSDDIDLTKAAFKRALEIETRFEHIRPDGSSCFTALDDFKVKYVKAGENIQRRSDWDPANSVLLWMNSPGHKQNILDPDFTHISVGVYKSSGTYKFYIVQLFIKEK